MSALGIMDAMDGINLGLTDEEVASFVSAWKVIPEDRRPAYDAAYWMICVANGTSTPPPPWVETDAGRVYWAAGYADRLISALDSFAAIFTGGDLESAIDTVQRIADWFDAKGVATLRGALRQTFNDACTAHNAGLELRKMHALAPAHEGRRSAK